MLRDVLGVDALFLQIEQIFEVLHLPFELIDGIRVMAVEFSGFDLEGDVIGPLHELEGADGFVHVLSGGREVAEDEGEGIAGEGLLQESGEFGLPEGPSCLLVATGQCEDDLAESGEGEVDVLKFLQLLLPNSLLLVDLL